MKPFTTRVLGLARPVFRGTLGVKPHTLSKILRGERGISKRLAFALSERFGVPVAAFLEMK